jgi:hypothetical protein
MPPKKKKAAKDKIFSLSNQKEKYNKAEKSTIIQELPSWQIGKIPDWYI